MKHHSDRSGEWSCLYGTGISKNAFLPEPEGLALTVTVRGLPNSTHGFSPYRNVLVLERSFRAGSMVGVPSSRPHIRHLDNTFSSPPVRTRNTLRGALEELHGLASDHEGITLWGPSRFQFRQSAQHFVCPSSSGKKAPGRFEGSFWKSLKPVWGVDCPFGCFLRFRRGWGMAFSFALYFLC